MVFVRPKQNSGNFGQPAGTKYAYNDGDGSTRYDREFAFMITELWSAAHYRDAHIQVSDWTDFDPQLLAAQRPRLPGHPRAERRPAVHGGGPAAVPADLLAGHLQRRRAGAAADVEPRLPEPRDDGRQHRPDDRRQGRQPAQGPRRHRELHRRPTPSTSGPARAATSSSRRPARASTCSTTATTRYLDNGGGPGYGGMMTKILVEPAGTLGPQTDRQRVTQPRRPA